MHYAVVFLGGGIGAAFRHGVNRAADAMVWALTELFQPPKAEPRVRAL